MYSYNLQMRHHSSQNVVHNLLTIFYYNINVKENVFFWEHDQDRDTKKEQALYITFSQSNWFIAQNECFWLAITTRNSYHMNPEWSKATVKLNVYSQKYNFNCSVNIQVES